MAEADEARLSPPAAVAVAVAAADDEGIIRFKVSVYSSWFGLSSPPLPPALDWNKEDCPKRDEAAAS